MFSESSQVFADSAADYLGATDQRQRVRQLEDSDGGFDRATWQQIAALGWLSILVPEEDGGLGLGLEEVAAIAHETGKHLLAEPFVDAGVHPVALVCKSPAGALRSELLAALQSGETVAGVAWQERAGDIDIPPAPSTTYGLATQQLTGRKRFVRPGLADGWLVLADAGGEAAIVWVKAGAPGVTATQECGVDGSLTATLSFEASPAALLVRGDSAMAALQFANESARLAQAAELAGIARRALELTRDYLTTREQFGKPIGSFQALQHRMVDGLIQVELAAASLREGLALAGQAGSAHTLALAASRVKARCAHAATEVTRMAIQLHGAIGTTNEYDVGLYFKRAMLLASRWGNAAAHRRRYARLVETTVSHRDPAGTPPPENFPADADWDAMPEQTFRCGVRALFAKHYPEHRRYMPYRQSWAESKDWYLTLSRLGWLAPAWPKQHGGMGLPADKLIAWIEETEAWGVARCPDQGLVMVGPILMRFGNDEQRARFLPPILAGEHVWTQGYSEPNAGSDLAAVRTEAVIDGDDFIVNGQKTWTTWGADGTHMFMLVRTDKTVKKQAGISFLLVDLKTPGVTVRPIRNIAGEREFCEVFFDNVRVPRSNLVGELNQGWTVAKALLGFERLFTGSPKHSQHTLHQVEKLARQRGLFDDPAFVARLTELQLDTADLGAAYAGFAAIAKRGEPIPASISMLKIWSTETYEKLALLLIESADDYGGMQAHCKNEEIDMHVVAPLFNCLGAKIFAGSNEIQRNILAKAVLDLPS
ncbi:MAG: acyl-CoA dehydrogenase [Polaromonas sp.]|uniref:acyl-CoA dehydrogenase n=1 Tax=Polaromonas sp. TaxID=1869339 RepID=UPI0025F61D2B|nr:acyl-CoA dehydrogenase [Polaromonas sp.]MBI2726885.1 acyl-CoA dehydrogenase [Polaromonas sp.]